MGLFDIEPPQGFSPDQQLSFIVGPLSPRHATPHQGNEIDLFYATEEGGLYNTEESGHYLLESDP